MLHFGTRLFGKVDQVPGLFYVATKFVHLNFIPVIPTGSHLIFVGTETADGFQGSAIGLSVKSILFAWVRAALFAAAGITAFTTLLAGTLAIGEVGPADLNWWSVFGIEAALAVLFCGLLWASYAFSKASPMRALKLANRVGISPEDLAPYFVHSTALPWPEDLLPPDPEK